MEDVEIHKRLQPSQAYYYTMYVTQRRMHFDTEYAVVKIHAYGHARSNPQVESCIVKNVQNVGVRRGRVGDGRGGGWCPLQRDRFRMCCLHRVGHCFRYRFGIGSLFRRGLRMVLLVVALGLTGHQLLCPQGFLRHFLTRYFGGDQSHFGH